MRWLLIFLFPLTVYAAPPVEIEQQANCLQAILKQADDAYFNKHESIMSDEAYDALRGRYDGLLKAYPELVEQAAANKANDSKVGAAVKKSDPKIEHTKPILSLAKAYTDEAVLKFIKKSKSKQFHIEPKIDGLTVVLHYQNGVLMQAATRGDGQTGSDITKAILASGCVPAKLKLPSKQLPKQLVVRGEVYLSKKRFAKLNKRRIKEGKSALKSPRNSAAGTLRLDDFAEIARRGIEMKVFSLIATDSPPATQKEAIDFLLQTGLPVVDGVSVPGSQALQQIEEFNKKKGDLPYLTDGFVIKVSDRKLYDSLGATSHHPRGALARKYKSISVDTILLGVQWKKGATGKLTPVASFKPVEVDGATIKNATLHNLDHLRALDLMIGDHIKVTRAGGSVPEIISADQSQRDGSEKPIPDPK